MSNLDKTTKEFIKYLTNEKRYPETTISSYERDLDNYYGYIELKKLIIKILLKMK